MIPIDKGNKPIPSAAGGGASRKYPFADMSQGDSFFAPGVTASGLISSGRGYLLRHPRPGYRFVCRTVTENGVKGARIWLVKDGRSK